MKDPTRGGLSATLNEFAKKSGVGLLIDENELPFQREVLAASQMLGLDPLQVTCEGKALIAVEAAKAEDVLRVIRSTKYGKKAQIIGEARDDLEVEYEGEEIDVGFNSQYLLDFLMSINVETIRLELKDENSAAILKPGREEKIKYTYVVMPMKI